MRADFNSDVASELWSEHRRAPRHHSNPRNVSRETITVRILTSLLT